MPWTWGTWDCNSCRFIMCQPCLVKVVTKSRVEVESNVVPDARLNERTRSKFELLDFF